MGRIVATVCAIYGWAPHYVLHSLSWPQVLLFHDRGIEYDFARRGVLLNGMNESVIGTDEPDVDAIESQLGDLIKR